MIWSASVLSTVSSDTEPTIIIAFDSAKYIFNVGENTNRAFLQSRRNWKRTRGLFFTQVGTQRAGGLPGAFFSQEDGVLFADQKTRRHVDDLCRRDYLSSGHRRPSRTASLLGFHAFVHLQVSISESRHPLFLTLFWGQGTPCQFIRQKPLGSPRHRRLPIRFTRTATSLYTEYPSWHLPNVFRTRLPPPLKLAQPLIWG